MSSIVERWSHALALSLAVRFARFARLIAISGSDTMYISDPDNDSIISCTIVNDDGSLSLTAW